MAERKTILLVEDDEAVLELLELILESNGYEVLAAAVGEDAIRIMDAHPDRIHLLISDIMLPDMSGRRLETALRERRPDTRILFISGHPQEDLDEYAAVSQQANFLSKPFGSAILLKKVGDIIAAR